MADATLQRNVFTRISIPAGNLLQVAGLVAAGFSLAAAASSHSKATALAAMILAWVLLYFFCHAIAHWLVGRLVGIRFRYYTIGGTGNPDNWPGPLRWVFEHLPFFGVQTEKTSMAKASPTAIAVMWSAGVTSSALVPTLAALWAWRSGVPWGGWFSIFAAGWAFGTLSSNWRSKAGDYSKARRALEK